MALCVCHLSKRAADQNPCVAVQVFLSKQEVACSKIKEQLLYWGISNGDQDLCALLRLIAARSRSVTALCW